MHTPDPVFAALDWSDLLWVLLYGEARGEPLEGQVAVGLTVINRLADMRWGATLPVVILDWAQYSCLWPTLGGADFEATKAFAERVSRYALPQFDVGERQLRWIAEGLLGKEIVDITDGATHYYAGPAPFWAIPPAKETAVIGHHHFWAGVK